MKRLSDKEILYTANDEEPDCGRCDHITDGEWICIHQCGSEHGWNGYERVAYDPTK